MKIRNAVRFFAVLCIVITLAAGAAPLTIAKAPEEAAKAHAGAIVGAKKEQSADTNIGAPPASVAFGSNSENSGGSSLFDDVNFLQFFYNPRENYVYNSKFSFQWLFGFNKLYDSFDFLANCYVDTIRCKFNYEGKDWMVQLWKGSYGVCLAIGGEIGIYNKPEYRPLEHYNSAYPEDWINMEMSIYHNGELLFTRPFERYWWCTGFQPGILEQFWVEPRSAVTMKTRLEFDNADMALLFAECLRDKGFTQAGSPPSEASPEQYYVNNNTVHLSWRNIAE